VNPTDLSPLANHLWQSTLFAAVAGLLTLALQIYFDRWQIEVNHREEKDTPGGLPSSIVESHLRS
jgi:hypothetical protein